MGSSIVASYWQMLRTAWTYIGSGAIFRLARLRKGPTIAALYPIVALIVQLAVALALGAVLAAMLAALVPAVPGWGRALVALVGASAVLTLFRRLDSRFFAYYLMHDYAHAAQAGGAYPVDLEQRLAEFRTRIAAALTGDWDEVLLADLLRAGEMPKGRVLGFLSLGQVVPMVSFLPEARRLRGDLAYLAARPELTWVDVTAPGDGCAFALCDPVAVTGVAPQGRLWPLVVSAAFTQTLSPGRWRELRWRFFRLHFQYLCAFDRPGDYDFFQSTAGPLTLAQRYSGRAPSKSRIETPMSGYRGCA